MKQFARSASLWVASSVALLLALNTTPALGQLYNQQHPGTWLMGTAPWKADNRMSGPEIFDCAGGPHGAMIVASGYNFFESVSPGLFESYPYLTPLIGTKAFEDVADGLPLGKKPALENTGDFRSYYVGFSCDTGMNHPGSHLFRMELDGHVEMLVPVVEFTAAAPGVCAGISEIGVAPDGTLLIMLAGNSNSQRQLVSVDLDKPPGQRVTPLLSDQEMIDNLPVEDDLVVTNVNWGLMFAVDDLSRVFHHVEVVTEGPDGSASMGTAIVRLDSDGTLVLMTHLESGASDMQSSLVAPHYPALGMQGGLEFDPTTGMIVGVGYGAWLMHPDRPHSGHMVIAPEQIAGMASALVGDDWTNRSPLPSIWGSCLAITESGAFATKMYTYAAFQFDPDWLDLDQDGLLGWAEEQQGTDPLLADTDGGGILDGLELHDFTNPLDGTDDRLWAQAPDDILLTDDHVGSQFTDWFEPYGLTHHGVALWDNSVLVAKFEGVGTATMMRFKGYDKSPSPSSFRDTEFPLATDLEGNIYHMGDSAAPKLYQVVKTTPDGASTPAMDQDQVEELLGDVETLPHSWAADPDGRLWAGFTTGKILRTNTDGGIDLIYDGWQDLIDAGELNADGKYTAYGCSMTLSPKAMAWEPVRGVMLVALSQLYDCGRSGSFTSPVYAAIGHDDRIVRVGNSGDYPKVSLAKGGGDPMDIEPDWKGGFYLLLAHGVDRTLVHYDANWHAQVMQDLSLNYATDIIVTRSGQHYAIMGRQWGETPVHFVLRRFNPVTMEERQAQIRATLPSTIHNAVPHLHTPPVAPAIHQPHGTADQPGACSMGHQGAPAIALLILTLLAACTLLRPRRKGPLAAALMLALLAHGCGSSSKPKTPVTDTVVETRTDHHQSPDNAETLQPETQTDVLLIDPCQDVSNCQPSAAAVCLDDGSHKRCQLTPDGCWLWSQNIACFAGQACDQGICQECIPLCAPYQECGDDGCGGTCGQCVEGTVCCQDSFCGLCEENCQGRECGHDGAGGSCGECPAGKVCATGTCHPEGSGDCTALFDCLVDCAAWDQQCVSQCEAYLDKPSNKLAASIIACQEVLCTDCPEGEGWQDCVDLCIFSQCAEPFTECYAQGGTYKCKELYTCAFACHPSDQLCLDECYFNAFPSHLQYAIKLELCVDQFCDLLPPEPSAWECWEDAVLGPCNDQFATCLLGQQCDNSCDGIDCGLNDCLLPCGPPCN